MKYEIGEILNQAIMTGTISLVVEGIDDIKIYETISNEVGKNVIVFPIGCVEGYSPGCGHVIPAMDAICELPEGDKEHKKYILGIIDKDVKDFRGEIPVNPLVLTLRYYSLESHFINKEVVKESLSLNTKTPPSLLTDEFMSLIFNDIFYESESLYLMSLEALKCSIDNTYDSCFQYSFSEGRIFSSDDQRKILEKRDDLISFSESLGITATVENLKIITKGKWLIHYVSHKLANACSTMHTNCGVPPQSHCVVCESGSDNKSCLYRTKDGVTPKSFKNSLFGNMNSPDIQYIKDRISVMA
ncbi:TPA: DUF4435 domain-containing protein [Klebsiella pneumoniae]|nr:DUF4435 domain-containing protein [Klebsiella pneumoniae]